MRLYVETLQINFDMSLSSHPVHASDAMSSSSYQAFEGQEPISPTTSIQPIVRPATPGASSDLSTSTSLSRSQRQKHDSFIMSGSVFLITSDGRTLSLPIPSESPYDPLNWSWKRRVVALTPGILFAWAGLILTTGASLTMNGLITDFITQVCPNLYYHSQPCLIKMHSCRRLAPSLSRR